jgi:hypothetical protein
MICNASVIALSLAGGMARPLGAHELKFESLTAADLLDARESIAVGSLKLRLTAYLWRDFMPMALADDSAAAREALTAARGVMASVKVIDENGKSLPKSLHAEVVCVVQGGHIWQTSAIEESRDESKAHAETIEGFAERFNECRGRFVADRCAHDECILAPQSATLSKEVR